MLGLCKALEGETLGKRLARQSHSQLNRVVVSYCYLFIVHKLDSGHFSVWLGLKAYGFGFLYTLFSLQDLNMPWISEVLFGAGKNVAWRGALIISL